MCSFQGTLVLRVFALLTDKQSSHFSTVCLSAKHLFIIAEI